MKTGDPIKLLHIDSATHICSIAISQGDDILILKESSEPNSHSRLLTVFIEEALKENQMKVKDLDAISISIGPGSYTGLRIGVSVAKGLAFGAGIPVIPIDTLLILAKRAIVEILPSLTLSKDLPVLLKPMLDARRMEVYTALYDLNLIELEKVQAKIIDEDSFKTELENKQILFFGNGAEKCRELITHQNAIFIQGIESSSAFMLAMALEKFRKKEFADTAYFEPFYLKDFIATIPKNKIIPDQPDRGDLVD